MMCWTHEVMKLLISSSHSVDWSFPFFVALSILFFSPFFIAFSRFILFHFAIFTMLRAGYLTCFT